MWLVKVVEAIDKIQFCANQEDLFQVIFWHEEIIQRTPSHWLIERYVWLASHRDEINAVDAIGAKVHNNYYSLNLEKSQIEDRLDDLALDIDELNQQAEAATVEQKRLEPRSSYLWQDTNFIYRLVREHNGQLATSFRTDDQDQAVAYYEAIAGKNITCALYERGQQIAVWIAK